MTIRTQKIFDAQLMLRNVADGAETSTAAETAISFPVRSMTAYKCVFNVTAVDVSSTNETYTLSVEVSDLVGGTFTTVASRAFAAGAAVVGSFELALSGAMVEGFDDDSAFVRVKATLGGTTPSITYGAFLTKI